MQAVGNFVGRGLQAAGRAISNEHLNQINEQPVPEVNPELAAAEQARAIAQARRDEALAIEELQVVRARAAQRQRHHTQQAFHEVCLHMYGKKIDSGHKQFVAAKVMDYLEQNNVEDREVKHNILRDVYAQYLVHMRNEPHLHLDDILAAREHNRDLEGRIDNTRWYNPWTWHLKQTVSENINGSSAEHSLYSVSQVIATGLVVAGATAVAIYGISKAYSAVQNIITTPKVQLPPMQPLRIDIPQLSCLNMKLDELINSTATSVNSLSIQNGSLDRSTSAELVITLSGRCMSSLSKTLKAVGGQVVELLRSQK
uniref:Uncharacterized protein n=1 Tax=Hymenopteran tombus-related virus TaxID=2822555 RepID=A0A8A6RH30_9TOMB|nr:hypothetical protein [Hymenopteran tombus-related virus]